MDATNPGYQLAAALEAIRKEEETFAAMRDDHKARLKTLHEEVAGLKLEILTGQKGLFAVEHDVEENGKHIAEVPEVPGAMAYGDTPEEAEQKAVAIAEEVKADELLDKAISACREKGRACVSDLREWFGIQTGRAMHLIDKMDERGLLLPAEGSGPRKFREVSA